MPSQHNIDNLSLQIFGKGKFFIECGGAHPSDQNNTELLEKNDWKGIVVEPSLRYNAEYRSSRPNTLLENYALVGKDFKEDFIEGTFDAGFGGSVIKGFHGMPWNPSRFPVSTVSKILYKHGVKEVHLATVDVEGYENEVLNGFDFEKVKFHLIVPEFHGLSWNNEFGFLEDLGFEKIGDIGNQEVFGRQHLYFNTKSDYIQIARNLVSKI